MNLLEYLETLSLNEANQPTLKNLIDNYRKVFPYSDKDIQVVNWHIDGKDKQDTVIKGLVKSQSGNGSYNVIVELHRDNLETPLMFSLVGKVNCTCNAFRYNVAYPDAKYNVLGGVVKSYNRIPNKIRNSKQIPTVCKHVYRFLHFLYNKNILVG